MKLNGQSLVERAMLALVELADEVIVALPPFPVRPFHIYLPDGARLIQGGLTRQETVLALLEAVDSDLVLIHDAARPFLPPEVTRAVLEAALETGAATAALPAADTLVLEEEGRWGGLLERSRIRAVQTPQGFRRDLLLEAHRWAALEGWAATDDAGLVARLGHPVALVTGDPRLFKLTRPGDWALAQAFAPAWDAEQG